MHRSLPIPALAIAGAIAACGPKTHTGTPVVLISMDTLRADRLGAFGSPLGLTPNLDAFAAEAVIFDRAWSQAVQTGPSHSSVFTSRYPSEELGEDGKPYIPEDMPVLAKIFSIYGYHTGAFVAGGELREHGGLSAGFDTYQSSADFGSLWNTTPMALSWLDSLSDDKPYFLFVHGYDTHSRYLKPTPFGYTYSDARATGVGAYAVRTASERIIDGLFYADFNSLVNSYATELRPRSAGARERLAAKGEGLLKLEPEDGAYIEQAYNGAVSYADAQFGLLMAALQERGVLDEALIVVMSDHGEQLGEHGLYGHCCEVNDEETHVPLMIRAPHAAGGGQRVSAIVELVDILPTVLEWTGLAPPAVVRGQSLVPALRGAAFEGHPYAITEGSEMMRTIAMRSPRGRLTFVGLSASSSMLPDLLETAAVNGPAFATSSPELTDEERVTMRNALAKQLRTLAQSGKGSRGEAPPELRKALREHGYWDVQP
jgi:arylsulfatase